MQGILAVFCFTLLLSFICPSKVIATDQTVKIREATYLFEMKGKYAEAEAILEEVSKSGDAKDRAEANFLLGKIKDLAGNRAMASFYYTENLTEQSQSASQAYWISERLAYLDNTPAKIFEKTIKLRSPSRQIFIQDSLKILTANKTFFSPMTGKYSKLPQEIAENAIILDVTENEIWWESENAIHTTPYKSILPALNIPIHKKVSAFKNLSAFNTVFIDNEQLVFYSGNSEKFRTEPKYKDCDISKAEFYSSAILLNCPDNALHLLSKEDGHEIEVISKLDPISKIYQDERGILLFSGNDLWYYSSDNLQTATWRKFNVNVEEINSFENYFVVLESSGNISLISKKTGETIISRKSVAASLLSLNTGLLGLFSQDGGIIAVDTLLQPLWIFHLGQAPYYKPWVKEGKLYYQTTPDSLKILNILHYGNKPILSQVLAKEANSYVTQKRWDDAKTLIDSILTIEPGNVEALFLKAIYLEETKAPQAQKNKAWAQVIRISTESTEARSKILEYYSQTINAKLVKQLPLSPHTLYPSFTSYKNSLLTLDPASRQIIAINAEKGDVQWTMDVGKMESSPVFTSQENLLAFASGFSIYLINLDKPNKTKLLELPGKVFNITFSENYLYASTWNGFLLKIQIPEFKLAWTRKIGNTPFFITPKEKELLITTLNGSIQHIWEVSGQQKNEGANVQSPIAQVVNNDSSLILLTTDQKIFIYENPQAPLITLSTNNDILSANLVSVNNKSALLVSLSNQEIRLYSIPDGNILWSFQGKNSLFGKMAIHENIAWIDQGEELLGLSLTTGKPETRHSIPGGAGTPFIIGHTLYSATPQRLLYFFNLP